MVKNRPQTNIRADRNDDWFNYRLRKSRVNSGYTAKMLAQEAGISLRSIYEYERLRATPSSEIAEKIAGALNKDVKFLFPNTFRQFVAELNMERKCEGHEGDTTFNPGNFEDALIENENPEEIAMRREIPEMVDNLLGILNYREREILKLRYGIGDGYSYTLEEVGRIFKITRERVRQIEAKAVDKLRGKARF